MTPDPRAPADDVVDQFNAAADRVRQACLDAMAACRKAMDELGYKPEGQS